jgi:hypothetical protein
MAAGPGEQAERQTTSWLTSGLHESVASLGVETLGSPLRRRGLWPVE